MNAGEERRQEDVRRLLALCVRSRGRLAVEPGSQPSKLVALSILAPTAGGPDFPARRVERTLVYIHLPQRYPFVPPVVEVRTPIYHPHVAASGLVCLGSKWLPTEGLDLVALRIARIVSFDPALINPQSPAHREANLWYAGAIRAHPHAFPTFDWDYLLQGDPPAKMRWRNL